MHSAKSSNRGENLFGKLIEHPVRIAENGAESLPVVMFVIRIENKGICYLALQVPHYRMVLPVLL
jgi:hypothetical protein